MLRLLHELQHLHRGSKTIEHFGRGAIERDLHIGKQVLTQVSGRQVGAIADDVAVLFQPTDPLDTGRNADVQLPGELRHGQPPILLQPGEDALVDLVQDRYRTGAS